jgi:NADPH-dependent 2,4-dienoyl-CoA reductase/sulfur reductase-like enzyme
MADIFEAGGPEIDVAVIGGGPAGLAAATAAKQAGVARVVLLDRQPQPGGIPQFCGHSPFGMREFRRVLRGPDYAARLVDRASRAGVEIFTSTTVVALRPGGRLRVTTGRRSDEILARRIIYATGVRETPRAARLISGDRAQGVMNTGALQSLVYLNRSRPFRRPVIIGSELVAFSAILTCRHAGMRPVAMIEASDAVIARWPSELFPRLYGIAVHTGTRLEAIQGDAQVTGVQLTGPDGKSRTLACDGVILTGQFIPEASLARCGHLQIDPATGGPLVDQFGRCSDPVCFATGNLLRPVETAGWSWREGRQTGAWVAADLAGKLPAPERELRLHCNDPLIKYSMPQKIALPRGDAGMANLQLRVSRQVRGELVALNGKGVVWRRKISARPERRILVPLAEIMAGGATGTLELEVRERPD